MTDTSVEKVENQKEISRDTDPAAEFEFGVTREDSAPANIELLREMIQAGLWYGRKKNRTHPKMKPFIFTVRNGIEIIDLVKTLTALEKAEEFMEKVISQGHQILFVGTQPSAKNKIEEIAKKHNQPYVINRWLGGTLTNFETLSKRVEHFKKLKSDQAQGLLAKYTKKEQLDFAKEIKRLSTFFSGVQDMNKLPGAVFTINANIHDTAVREARRLKIPVVAVINTDMNPETIDYPIPANDTAVKSMEWVLGRVDAAMERGKAKIDPVRSRPAEGTATTAVGRSASNGVDQKPATEHNQKAV